MKLKIIEEKENLKKYHDRLVRLILKYGEHYRKKHGEWVKLNLEGEKFLELDTWNEAISLKSGSGEYEYWTGFEPRQSLIYFGIDFGGFSSHADERQFIETIKDVEALYGK
jgi:hypothetical protein